VTRLADIVQAMALAGCTAEQIAAVTRALKKPSMTGAERQARYRAKKARDESDKSDAKARNKRDESDESDAAKEKERFQTSEKK
jgi:hypothetical protein